MNMKELVKEIKKEQEKANTAGASAVVTTPASFLSSTMLMKKEAKW